MYHFDGPLPYLVLAFFLLIDSLYVCLHVVWSFNLSVVGLCLHCAVLCTVLASKPSLEFLSCILFPHVLTKTLFFMVIEAVPCSILGYLGIVTICLSSYLVPSFILFVHTDNKVSPDQTQP